MESQLLDRIRAAGVIAVVTIEDVETAIPLAETLSIAGIKAIELTLRTDAAVESIRRVRAAVPKMLVGAGTVLTPEQVKVASDHGAQFAVAPGFNANVVQSAQKRQLPFAPGIATPTDIEAAVELGCTILKFFPAEPIGGLKYLRSMATPYRHLGLQFVPLGGLNADNMTDYLRDPLIAAIGGSWIAPSKEIQQRQWETIRERASAASKIVKRYASKS